MTGPAAPSCPFAATARPSPWLDAEGLRAYLNLATREAACEWARKHKLPRAERTKFLVRVENVDRVLAGYPTLPHSAFLKWRRG